MCANWVYKNETIPPVLFTELYPIIDEKYHIILNDLIDLKSREIEKSNEPVDVVLIELVRDIVMKNNSIKNDLINRKPNPEEFNTFFLKVIK